MDNWYKGRRRSPLLPGPNVILDGADFTLPLDPKAFESALPAAQAADEAGRRGDVVANLAAGLEAACALLRVNYLDMTVEMIEDHSTLDDLKRFWLTVVLRDKTLDEV